MSELATTSPPKAGRRELVSFLPIERVKTSLAVLRSPLARRRGEELADLPLRGVPREDGGVELVDGFKRLERWRALGYREVPVVLERERSVEEAYALVLAANGPRRTVTAMDEARVVLALLERPGVGESTVARLLGRKPWWVARRRVLGTHLVASVQRRIDMGTLRPTVANALTRVRGREQERVVYAIETHALTTRESLALVEAYRSTEDARERAALRRVPGAWVRRPVATSPFGAVAAQVQERLDRARRVLLDLVDFALPADGLSDGERRRLEAEWRSVLHQLRETSAALGVEGASASPDRREEKANGRRERELRDKGGVAGDPAGAALRDAGRQEREEEEHAITPPAADHGRATSGDPPPLDRGALGDSPDREEAGTLAKPRANGLGASAARTERLLRGVDEEGERERVAPRPLPPLDRRAGLEGDHDVADPPRDPGGGLRGQPDDPGRARPVDPTEARREARSAQASLRDDSG
jgi:hypothetical protein